MRFVFLFISCCFVANSSAQDIRFWGISSNFNNTILNSQGLHYEYWHLPEGKTWNRNLSVDFIRNPEGPIWYNKLGEFQKLNDEIFPEVNIIETAFSRLNTYHLQLSKGFIKVFGGGALQPVLGVQLTGDFVYNRFSTLTVQRDTRMLIDTASDVNYITGGELTSDFGSFGTFHLNAGIKGSIGLLATLKNDNCLLFEIKPFVGLNLLSIYSNDGIEIRSMNMGLQAQLFMFSISYGFGR